MPSLFDYRLKRMRNRGYIIRKEAEAVGIELGFNFRDKSIPIEEKERLYEEAAERVRKKKEELGLYRKAPEIQVANGKTKRENIRKEEEQKTNLGSAEKELASRELARRSLLHYIERVHTDYEAGWVHEDICRRLEKFVRDVEARKSPRLMLFLPPRSGKSLIASTYFPAWVLGRHPEWEFIMASYSADLPIGFSRKVRNQVQSTEYEALFPTAKMSKDSTSAESWRTTLNGGLRAAGVGGGITGMGAHCIPHNAPILWYTPICSIKVGDFVDGYDHSTECVVRVRVLGVSASPSRKDITSVGDLRCTADHRVFTANRGYVPSAALEGADSLVVLPLWRRVLSEGFRGYEKAAEWAVKDVLLQGLLRVQQDRAAVLWSCVPRMRWVQKVSRSCQVSDLLQQGAQRSHSFSNLRSMWDRVQSDSVRGAESRERETRPLFLLTDVLRRIQTTASRAAEDIWHMSALWWRHHVPQFDGQVLLSQVLSRFTSIDTKVRRLCGSVLSPKINSSWTRWTPMCFVREKITSGSSPHQFEFDLQRDRQLGIVVQGMSLTSTRTGVSAADLAGYSGFEEYVVDIQTSTGNFFAGGVLIHNCFMIDDPVKDMSDADSQTIRESTWEWYSSTAYTRLAPGGGLVIIQTRWNCDDLSGRLISKMNESLKLQQERAKELEQLVQNANTPEQWEQIGIVKKLFSEEFNAIDQWEIVEYQALATADEYLERSTGKIVKDEGEREFPEKEFQLLRRKDEALHEARFPRPLLLRYKQTMQPRHWAALYQQNPVPDEGLFFTKDLFVFRPHLPPIEELNCYAAWDLAIGSKNANDYTVGVVGGIDGEDNLWILDMYRGRWSDLFKTANHIIDAHVKYNCLVTGIEKGQLELALKPILARVMKERRTYITLAEGDSALKPVTDKVVRARPLQGRMQQGTVLFPKDMAWVDVLQDELLKFPAGSHDDAVDAMAWLARMTSGQAPPIRKMMNRVGKGFKSWKDRLNTLTNRNHEKAFMGR